jgi:hypothetical protein
MSIKQHTRTPKITHWLARAGTVAAALGLWLGVVACDQKDSGKCQEGQAGVKKSLEAGDDALLNQWRTYAHKYCEGDEFVGIDREITETRAAKAKAEADQKRQQQENDQLLQVFTQWVAGARNDPATGATPACEGGEKEEKSQERWCVGSRQAGAYQLNVRYWDKERVAAKFDVAVPHPITCEKIGGTALRTWNVPNQPIKRHHCQINAGALSGMQAMVSEAANAPLHVFSPQYVEKDPALKQKLSTEGM